MWTCGGLSFCTCCKVPIPLPLPSPRARTGLSPLVPQPARGQALRFVHAFTRLSSRFLFFILGIPEPQREAQRLPAAATARLPYRPGHPPPAPLQGAAALGTESLRGGAQSVHRASSPAPFLGLTGGSRNAAMRSNGPLSLEAWRTPTLRGSPKPRRAGQGQRGTKAIFKSKGAAGSPSDIFFKTCIYLLNNVC